MHQSVMVRTQQHQVFESGFAAVGPVDHVVAVQETGMGAAREAAAAVIAGVQCAALIAGRAVIGPAGVRH
jgi:hypothetical protein